MTKSRGRAQRQLSFIKAQIWLGEEWAELAISNVSATGFMAKGANPPSVGTAIEVRHRGLSIKGEVVWTTRTRFGVRSFEPIDLDVLLAKSGLGEDRSEAKAPEKRRLWGWQTKRD